MHRISSLHYQATASLQVRIRRSLPGVYQTIYLHSKYPSTSARDHWLMTTTTNTLLIKSRYAMSTIDDGSLI